MSYTFTKARTVGIGILAWFNPQAKHNYDKLLHQCITVDKICGKVHIHIPSMIEV